jgi:hypothetical protein
MPSPTFLLLVYLVGQYEKLLVLHEQVEMDTDTDRELHQRAVTQFREALKPVTQYLDMMAAAEVGGP